MLQEYLRAALEKAHYEILSDDKTYYGEIPGFDGVWANASTLEACRRELEEVLEEWLLLRISKQLPIPVVDGLELAMKDEKR
jgi:predicted RNase H-like HicB family nuclease